METEQEPVKVYSSYTEAQKRATKKYRELNKEKVNAQRKKYYDDRKSKDPDFLSHKREKAKEYYIKKKGLKEDVVEDVIVEEIIQNVPQIPVEEILLEPEPEKPIIKTKAPRKPRMKKEISIKENIKPEDLEEIKEELIKSFEAIEIIHNDPIVPQLVPDTEDEHLEKKAKKPRLKRSKE